MKKITFIFVFFLLSQCYLNAQEIDKDSHLVEILKGLKAVVENNINNNYSENRSRYYFKQLFYDKNTVYLKKKDKDKFEIAKIDDFYKKSFYDYDIEIRFDQDAYLPKTFSEYGVIYITEKDKQTKALRKDPYYYLQNFKLSNGSKDIPADTLTR